MELYLGLMVFLTGLAAGSFVNMLVYRTAIRYKIKKSSGVGHRTPSQKRAGIKNKRSFCDYCGRQLSWFENIPIVSWALQRGKTRCCRRPLPYSYPLIELLTAGLFLLNFQFQIFNFQTVNQLESLEVIKTILTGILGLIVITMLVFEAEFDRRYMILPDFGIVILILSTVFLWIVQPYRLPLQNVIAASLGAFGFLLFLHLITKGKGMGMGDVKLALFMGLLLGWPKIVIAFYVAFIVGAIYGLILIIFMKMSKKSLMPFGPFLILATIVIWRWGEIIVKILDTRF